MLIKTILTFICFIGSLSALLYFTMEGRDGGLFAVLSGSEDTPQPVFYRSIGVGDAAHSRFEPAQRVAQVYTLELTTAASKGEADLLIAKLLKSGVRAFYSEIKHGDRTVWSIRKGVFSSLQDAQSASQVLLAERQIKNSVIELN